jgi:hypothetical protein
LFNEEAYDDLQEKRKKSKETQAKNIYPHNLSRGGYDFLEEKMIACQQASDYPSTIVSPPSPPTRHEKWKRARVKKTRGYTMEETRVVAEKIVSYP